MMFPTAASVVQKNEDGEVIGWESTHDDAPDADEGAWFWEFWD